MEAGISESILHKTILNTESPSSAMESSGALCSSDAKHKPLDQLPYDVLCDIFVCAQWPSLSMVSRNFYQVSKSTAVRARYYIKEFGRESIFDGKLGLLGHRRRLLKQDIVLLLLNLGADPRADDQWLLRHSCTQNWLMIVWKLLQLRQCNHTPHALQQSPGVENWRGGQSIICYCKGKHSEESRMLIDVHADDDEALRIASGMGNIEIAQLLLDYGANINVLNSEPLVLAASHMRLPTLKMLISRGADINAENSRALRSAILPGDSNIRCIRELLDNGADIHAIGDSSLLTACYKGDGELPPPPTRLFVHSAANDAILTKAELLKYSYSGVSSNGPLGSTVGIGAISSTNFAARRQPRRYHNQTMPFSDELSPDIIPCATTMEIPSSIGSQSIEHTPFTENVHQQQQPLSTHLGVVRLLLAYGADANARNGRPLSYACSRGSPRIAAVLLAYGAEINAQDGEPLCEAAEAGHLSVVRLLLHSGANSNASNGKPLINAAQNGHLDVLRELIAHGANPCNSSGILALRAAARAGWANIVSELIQVGADSSDREFREYASRIRSLRKSLRLETQTFH